MKIIYFTQNQLVSLSTLTYGEVFETHDGELFMVIDSQDYLKKGILSGDDDCPVLYLKTGILTALGKNDQVIHRTDAQLTFKSLVK